MATPIDWLPRLLQNSDSLFPTGAYAHSSGLEEIVRLGLVTDEASLKTFLHDHVIPQLENLELPYVHFAFAAGLRSDLSLLAEISAEIGAWKLSREARAASLQMGQGRLAVARQVFPHPALELLAVAPLPKHLIVVYGWQMALAAVPVEAALGAYFYQSLAGTVSAALKLIRIGQQGTQRVLAEALARTESVVAAALEIERPEAGWFSPVLEIAALRHERAGERLFIS